VIGHETAPELHSITSGRPVTPPPEPPKRRTVYRSYRIEEVPTKSSACRRLQRADGQDNPSARALTVLVDDAAQLHVGVTGSGPDALFLSGGPGRVNYFWHPLVVSRPAWRRTVDRRATRPERGRRRPREDPRRRRHSAMACRRPFLRLGPGRPIRTGPPRPRHLSHRRRGLRPTQGPELITGVQATPAYRSSARSSTTTTRT